GGAVASEHGVEEVANREREREDRVRGSLLGGHGAVLDLDVPVPPTRTRHVILHAEVLRHRGAALLLRREARGKELLEELLRGDVLGNCRLLGHGVRSSSMSRAVPGGCGDRPYCHSS